MPDQSSIVSGMITALSAVEPSLDTSIGTTVRNILDVTSQQISEAYIDSNLSQYQNAIDSLTGSALDSFLTNFGFTRFAAKYATGIVSFTQAATSVTVAPITIPAGTQVVTASGVIFQTVSSYTMTPVLNQTTSVSIPVQALVGGITGNVAAGTITALNTPVNGITSVTNPTATSGGTASESDAAVIARFKATVFRSYTGTSQSFLGAALDVSNVTTATVLGAKTSHIEQVTFSGGTATSVLNDAAFVYPYNSFAANDLSASTSTSTSGNITLTSALTAGATITSLGLSSTTSVTLQAGTQITIGYQTATVTSTVTVSSPTTVSIASFTPATAITANTTVTYIYNSGQFYTYGVDYTIATTPLVANPSAPTLAQSTGGSFASGVSVSYQIAWATFNGMTAPSPAAAITTSAASTKITLTLPSPPTNYTAVVGGLYVFVYRSVSGGAYQLVGTTLGSNSTFVDNGNTPIYGTPPSSNTTGSLITLSLPSGSRMVNNVQYQVQFDYIPATSRNSYPNVLNCVDVYTVGTNPTPATQSLIFYCGPLVGGSASYYSTTGAFTLGTTLTSGTTYTSIVASSVQSLSAGAQIYLISGTTVQVATVSQNVTSSTIPVESFTASATYTGGIQVPLNNSVFSGYSTSPLFIRNFQRPDGTLPAVGNTLIPLSFGPVLTLPASVPSLMTSSGASVPASLGSSYYLVNETDTKGMSNQSISGIEWVMSSSNGFGTNVSPTGGTTLGTAGPLTVSYTYNSVPFQVYSAIQMARLLSHDVMVHQAYPVYMDFSFVVVFSSTAVAVAVQAQINAALSTLLANITFNGVLEASQVLGTVLSVPGVANARWATQTDANTYSTLQNGSTRYYALQSVNTFDSVIETFSSPTLTNVVTDVQFTSITVPVFNATHIASVSQNAFATGYSFIEPL